MYWISTKSTTSIVPICSYSAVFHRKSNRLNVCYELRFDTLSYYHSAAPEQLFECWTRLCSDALQRTNKFSTYRRIFEHLHVKSVGANNDGIISRILLIWKYNNPKFFMFYWESVSVIIQRHILARYYVRRPTWIHSSSHVEKCNLNQYSCVKQLWSKKSFHLCA